MSFDGKDDWVDVNITNSPKWSYTIAAWIKPTDKSSRIIFRRAHCSALYLDGSNVRMYFKRSDHDADSITISDQHIDADKWNFVAASVNLNKSKAKVMVNNQADIKDIDLNESTNLMSGGGLEDFIGGGSSLNGCPNADYFEGKIDNIQFYDRSLDIEEMEIIHEGERSNMPELGFWSITSKKGDVINDYSENENDGKPIEGSNILDNSGFESGTDNTGNMDNIRTNNAGSSWISDYSLYGEYSGRHNKTGENDQWSAVEWTVDTLNKSTQYSFDAWYKCSGDVSASDTAFSIRIFNGTGWHLEGSTSFDYKCDGRWNTVSGRVGSEVSTLQDSNVVRFEWAYSTNLGQMFVDNISLREAGSERTKDGFERKVNAFSKGILGSQSSQYITFDSYLTTSNPGISESFLISA